MYYPRPVFEKFLQTLMDGLAVGSLYALIALGYTMVYGILKFINFAHSDVFVLGAWVSFSAALAGGWTDTDAAAAGVQPVPIAGWIWVVLIVLTGAAALLLTYERLILPRLDPALGRRLPATRISGSLALVSMWAWSIVGLLFIVRGIKLGLGWNTAAGVVILILAMATCGLVGFSIERLAYKPLRKAPRLNVLITAIGVSLLLQNLGQLNWLFGTRPQGMPTLLPDKILATIGGHEGGPNSPPVAPVLVRLVDVIGAGTAVILMVLLDWLVFRTKLGRAMRAVSFSPANASLMGIPVDRVISFTFVLGAALAAAAGFLMSQKYSGLNQTAAGLWVLLGLKAFVAAVIGGIGNIRGAMMGGILIGLLEFFGMAYINPELRDVYVFSLLILVLLFRPSGLLGKAVTEKV